MSEYDAKPLDTSRPLWDQQDKESEPAYGAFVRYRNMGRGERSHELVGQELGKNLATISKWSSKWSWVVRVMEYDRAEDRRKVEEHWEEIEKMSRRHASQAGAMGQMLMGPGMAIFKLMNERPNLFMEYFTLSTDEDGNSMIDFDRMDRVVSMAMSAARILPSVMEMERTARGQPKEITGEAANPRTAATQVLSGDPVKRAKAQELFAIVHGQEFPALPPAVMGTREGDE